MSMKQDPAVLPRFSIIWESYRRTDDYVLIKWLCLDWDLGEQKELRPEEQTTKLGSAASEQMMIEETAEDAEEEN